jgi:anion-transporting  ArsA/GET3 family ATPase
MTEDVKKWLESEPKNYGEGVRLFANYSKNFVLINNFNRKENRANMEKLVYELNKVVEQNLEARPKPVRIVKPVIETKPAAAPLFDVEVDDYLLEITKKQTELYNERTKLSNSLAGIESDEERSQVVDEISRLQDEYNELAEQKENYRNTGAIAKAKAQQTEEEAMSEVELIQRKKYLIEQRSRVNGKLKKEPDNVEFQTELAQLNAEFEDVKLQLEIIKKAND